jgi:hypothetical protein
MFKMYKLLFLCTVFILSPDNLGEVHGNELLSQQQWRQLLGMSGLRRSIALDSPMGELLTRNMSYRMSSNLSLLTAASKSVPVKSESSIAQFNSVASIGHNKDYDFFLKTTARHVDFEISDTFDASAKRLDFGILARRISGKSKPTYFGASLIAEENIGRPRFSDSSRIGDGIGIRLESGKVLNNHWSVSGKAEFLDWKGNKKMRSMNTDRQIISNSVQNERIYANIDFIRSLSSLNGRGSWRSGIHYLSNNFEDSIDSMGLPSTEPFGNSERLGIARTGYLQMWPIAQVANTTVYFEAMVDYEFENNMDKFTQDSLTLSAKAGIAWIPSPLRRIQLEWQKFEGQKGLRSREGIMLIILLDGI